MQISGRQDVIDQMQLDLVSAYDLDARKNLPCFGEM